MLLNYYHHDCFNALLLLLETDVLALEWSSLLSSLTVLDGFLPSVSRVVNHAIHSCMHIRTCIGDCLPWILSEIVHLVSEELEHKPKSLLLLHQALFPFLLLPSTQEHWVHIE